MNGIGLDCGTATVKLVMLSQKGELLWFKSSAHHGAAVQTVRLLLGELLQADRNACGYPPFGCFSANCCKRIAMLAAIR